MKTITEEIITLSNEDLRHKYNQVLNAEDAGTSGWLQAKAIVEAEMEYRGVL